MEYSNIKIPRLRESRYARNPKTCIDIKSSRTYVESQPSQLKRALSLTQIAQYDPLTPEQFTLKYKEYPHKFCKKSCIICGMGKPQFRIKGIKIEPPKVKSSSMCTQTMPPIPPPERWNAQTQTNNLEMMHIGSEKDRESDIQTANQRGRSKLSLYPPCYRVWFSLFVVIFALAVVLVVRHLDKPQWTTHKKLLQTNTFLDKVLSYFHRDKILSESSDSSVANVNVARRILGFLSLTLLLMLGIKISAGME